MTFHSLLGPSVSVGWGRVTKLVALCLSLGAVLSQALHAEGELDAQSVARGQEFVEANCSDCHATGRTGPSPRLDAPLFRTLGQRYPIEHLAEAFAEGVTVGHRDMPEFELTDPSQIDDLLAYLASIQD